MLRTIRATISMQQQQREETTLKVFFTRTRTDAVESSTIDCEAREEMFWPSSDLESRRAFYEKVRELLRGLLPSDSPSNDFFTNLLAGIACAAAAAAAEEEEEEEAELGFRNGSVLEARFDVDTCTPPRPKACMLCLKEYTLEDVVVHHRRCEHHFHRRCSEYYDDEEDDDNVDCVACSHDVKVIERIHVSVDGEKFEAEIVKFT